MESLANYHLSPPDKHSGEPLVDAATPLRVASTKADEAISMLSIIDYATGRRIDAPAVVADSTTVAPEAKPEKTSPLTTSLTNAIEEHEQADKQRSVLHGWLSHVWDGGTADSLAQLQSLKTEAERAVRTNDQAAISRLETVSDRAIKEDQQDLQKRETYTGYATGALTTLAFAFARGSLRDMKALEGVALASSVGLNSLDSMRVGGTFQEDLMDGTLGAAKGLALRSLYQRIGSNSFNPLVQSGVSAATGFVSRFGEYATSRRSYDGGLISGMQDALVRSMDLNAVALDLGTGLVAGGMANRLNRAVGGRLEHSIVARGIVSGSTYGLSQGAADEIVRERTHNQPFDLAKILESSVIQAGINSIPGVVGARVGERYSELSVDKPARGVTPLVEYKVTAESSRAAILKFVSERAAGTTGRNMALVSVHKVIGGRLGDSEVLMVKHSQPGEDLQRVAKFARTIACCTVADDPKINHVFRGMKDERGNQVVGDVRMHLNDDASSVAFTKSDITSVAGYERSVVLNGGSGHQVGIKAQNSLWSWLREPIPAGVKIEPGSLLERKARLHGVLKGYDMLQTERDSAADRAGIDFMFVHRPTKKLVVVDLTLDMPGKRGNSDFRNGTIFQLELERETLPGGAKMESVSASDKERFIDHLERAFKQPSILNLQDTMPPGHLANKSEAEKAADIARYLKDIGKKVEKVRILAGSDNPGAQLAREQLAQLQGYMQDLQPAVSYSRAHEKVSFDPNKQARTAALEQIVQDRIRAVVRQQANGTNTVTVSHGGRGNYDSQYDRYIVPFGNVSYVVENFTRRIKVQINKDIESAKSIDAKRRLTLDSIEYKLRTRIVDELNLLEPHELLGESRPYVRTAAEGTRMKPRDPKEPAGKDDKPPRRRSGFIKGNWVG